MDTPLRLRHLRRAGIPRPVRRASEPESQIARAIKTGRRQKGLTQKRLAQLLGTSQPALSRIERAKLPVSLSFLKRAVNILNITIKVTVAPSRASKLSKSGRLVL